MCEGAVEDDLGGRRDEHERTRARYQDRPLRGAPLRDAELGVRRDVHDAAMLTKRSTNYRNYFDQSTGFMRPKLEDGTWTTPFKPIDMGHAKKWRDYTEAKSVWVNVDAKIPPYYPR